MKKVAIAVPNWIGGDEAQDMVVRDLRAHALLKLEFYRSKMKPFEAKYATTFPRFQRRVEKGAQEDCAAWDDLIEWEAYYRGYQEWKKRYTELRQSPLVRELEVGEMIDEVSVQLLRVRAELIDGSLLYVREAIFPHTSKYSYHWQTSTGEMLLRWDNAPHHPEIPTHPHYKHDGERIGPAARVSIEDVLAELATRLQSKGEV